jgi:2-dehydropantoate 2-reductase
MDNMEFSKIVLFGAGATGTIVGALLAEAGKDVILVNRNAHHVTALNNRGAVITGGIQKIIPVKAVLPNQLAGTYDLIIYTVKSTADDTALPQLLPHLHQNSVVLTTQNGVPEEKIASFVGEKRTMGGSIVGWAASLPEAGVANFAGKPEEMLYKIGEMDGTITDRILKIKRLLESVGKVEISKNLAGMRWTKLIINVSMSGLSAALGCTFGEILDNKKAIDTALTLKLEALKTAKALGISVEQVNGSAPEEFERSIKKNPEDARAQLRKFFDGQRGGKPSMLQDLEKGKKTEIESINGFLSFKSAQTGISTPVNDTILKIVRGIQNKNFSLSMNNLDLIELLPFEEII